MFSDTPQSDAGFLQHIIVKHGGMLSRLSDACLIDTVLRTDGVFAKAELTRRVLLDTEEG